MKFSACGAIIEKYSNRQNFFKVCFVKRHWAGTQWFKSNFIVNQ
jgi:hypothetical protein